jgi:hypothetical protein
MSLKLKTLCIKRNHQKSKVTTYRMGEIFENHITDEGFITGIYNEQ